MWGCTFTHCNVAGRVTSWDNLRSLDALQPCLQKYTTIPNRNRQSQGQTNWFACDVINRSKIPWNRYNHITSCLFFVLKSKQLCKNVHSFDGAVYPFHKIYSESNATRAFWWRRIHCTAEALLGWSDFWLIYSYQPTTNELSMKICKSQGFPRTTEQVLD